MLTPGPKAGELDRVVGTVGDAEAIDQVGQDRPVTPTRHRRAHEGALESIDDIAGIDGDPVLAVREPIVQFTVDVGSPAVEPHIECQNSSVEAETSIGTLEYFDGVPSVKTVETAYDYLDRSRAVNVFMNSIPMLSMNALRDGQADAGCVKLNQICIFDQLMDSKSLFLTGNASTMYAIGFDLAKDGPVVIDLPTGMLGVLDDMAFRFMVNLGVAGPDKGKGRQVPAAAGVQG